MSGEHTPGEWVIGSANMLSDQPAIYGLIQASIWPQSSRTPGMK